MNWNFFTSGICVIFLITLFLIPLHIFLNIIENKDFICDNEKQGQFILECIKADTTKDFRAIRACEKMSIKLYCKKKSK